MNPIFAGTIRQGRFVPDLKTKFTAYLCAREGRRVECIIRPESKLRSEKQLNYYWGVMIPILSEATGYDQDSMHEVVKMKFYPKIEVLGEKVPMRSRDMTTAQIEARNTAIREWASEFLNCYIPKPNEVEY